MIRRTAQKGPRWPLFFLIIPVIALLWLPFYNQYDPQLFGLPFFYWYVLLWIILTALLLLCISFISKGNSFWSSPSQNKRRP